MSPKSAPSLPSWPAAAHPSARRPVVWVNCAMSVDGKIAYSGGAEAKLSGPQDYARVQQIRATSDAILVGGGTVRRDNPSLRIHWDLLGPEPMPAELLRRKDKPPLRVVMGSLKGIPPKSRFLDGSLPTVVFSVNGDRSKYPTHVTVVRCEESQVQVAKVLEWLKGHEVERLMVEGGSRVLTSFLRGGLVDRFTVFVSPQLIGGTRAPVVFGGDESRNSDETISLHLVESVPMDQGILLTYTL